MYCSRRSQAKLLQAYDPSLGRFLSRDPLGRAPLFGVNDNPYVYAGNNPLSNVDPSGQRARWASAAQVKRAATRNAQNTRMHHNPPGRDAHGKCTLLSTCESDKDALFGRLGGERTKNYAFGGGFAIVALLLKAYANKSDPLAELITLITLVQTYVAFAPLVVDFIFGATSGVAHVVSQSVTLLGQTLTVLQGIRASVNAMLAIGMFASLIPGIMDAFGIMTTTLAGPMAILQEAISVAATAFAYGAQAASGWYLSQASDIQHQMDLLGGMSTHQWCAATPGACGNVTNWNA